MDATHRGCDTSGMDTTHTERLLREAQEICRRVTGREEVGDDLLCSVFRRLEFESDLADDAPGDWPCEASNAVH